MQFQTNTIAITDYAMKSPTLAKVIISYTGNFGRDFVHSELCKMLAGAAQPIKASFKKVKEGVAVGFVKANRAVRVPTDKELKAMRVLGSNMLMDEADKSLWEVKSGATGKYLARHGQEDLSELVASTRHFRPEIPKLSHITIARAARDELVAFVDAEGDVDHGFATATSDTQVKVVSFARRTPMTINYDDVVSITPQPINAGIKQAVLASLTPEQKKQANEYWTRLYSYDPEYMRETIRQVNEGTFA